MYSGCKVHLLHVPRLEIIISSECFFITAVGWRDLWEGLQSYGNRVFLVQHQLKFGLFQVQNAWGEIIAVQHSSPQMWCQEPHQWVRRTVLHGCCLPEVTAAALPPTITGPSYWASFQTPKTPGCFCPGHPGRLGQLCFLTPPPPWSHSLMLPNDTYLWRASVWTLTALAKASGLPMVTFLSKKIF